MWVDYSAHADDMAMTAAGAMFSTTVGTSDSGAIEGQSGNGILRESIPTTKAKANAAIPEGATLKGPLPETTKGLLPAIKARLKAATR